MPLVTHTKHTLQIVLISQNTVITSFCHQSLKNLKRNIAETSLLFFNSKVTSVSIAYSWIVQVEIP